MIQGRPLLVTGVYHVRERRKRRNRAQWRQPSKPTVQPVMRGNMENCRSSFPHFHPADRGANIATSYAGGGCPKKKQRFKQRGGANWHRLLNLIIMILRNRGKQNTLPDAKARHVFLAHAWSRSKNKNPRRMKNPTWVHSIGCNGRLQPIRSQRVRPIFADMRAFGCVICAAWRGNTVWRTHALRRRAQCPFSGRTP